MAFVLSSFISFLSEISGLKYEWTFYLFFQTFAMLSAIAYRNVLHPNNASVFSRHVFAIVCGLIIAVCSYSWNSLHLVVQSTIPYIVIRFVSPRYAHVIVFTFTMLYLSAEHLRQQLAGIRADTDHMAPMMINVQKVTTIAFSIHDGFSENSSKLTKRQKELATRRIPSFIEYYSYIFHFQNLTAGPFCFYNHYIDFVEGKHVVPYKIKRADGREIVIHKEPPVTFAVLGKLFQALIMLAVVLGIGDSHPIEGNVADTMLKSSVLHRISYMMVSILRAQSKYIFAWSVADAICNASGLGFNGYDENGVPRWNFMTNINVPGFWMASSLTGTVANWHIPTRLWLKYVFYDRVPYLKDALTFALTAVWHGFFPGYYWTNATMVLTLLASRKVRYNVRPYFTSTQTRKLFYDVVTWIFHHVSLAYMTVPFVMLHNAPIVKFYRSVYFCGHIVTLVLILVLPGRKASKRIAADQEHTVTTTQNDYHKKEQ
ncbi:lysophospholipid acyltransferase 2-like [Ptychodera flava]|uniref:lysophospholipid acyltransferase 2-like n=1 Tax=Ptychodera flava TaxID=63121 RepID=UPI00396A42CB